MYLLGDMDMKKTVTAKSASAGCIVKNDEVEKSANRAMKLFGQTVKVQADQRKKEVVSKLKDELERIRPNAKRLLSGRA